MDPKLKRMMRDQVKQTAASIERLAKLVEEGRVDKGLASDKEETVAHLVSKAILFGMVLQEHVESGVITRKESDAYHDKWRDIATRSWDTQE